MTGPYDVFQERHGLGGTAVSMKVMTGPYDIFQERHELGGPAASIKVMSWALLLAYPGEQSVFMDDFGVEAFIEALDDYQLELHVRSQNPKDLEAAFKHASIMESFISTKGKRTEAEQSNASENPEKQPVDKYGGRVRSVTENGEIKNTEAFVRQVVERIQGVIKAK